jgi:hypothetical protein
MAELAWDETAPIEKTLPPRTGDDRAILMAHLFDCYCHLSLDHVIRSRTLSCLKPLQRLHIDCRLLMSWLGGSLAIMWSIVQSLPSKSLPHLAHTGSRMVLA